MDLFFYICLFIFGTMFGSFASVIIYRLKSGEGGILAGRSHCKNCDRNLSAAELIPIFSWLIQGGKCAGCKKKISSVYPLLEMVMGGLFVCVGIFLINTNQIIGGDIIEWAKMIFFLSLMFLTTIYVFYDILYLEIPESILLIANIGVFLSLIFQDIYGGIYPYLASGNFSILTFGIALMVISGLYIVMLAEFKEIEDAIILILCMFILGYYLHTGGLSFHNSALISGSIAALGIFMSFFLQIVLSGGRWMGAGDLRIAILMGMLVGASFAFSSWMITYLIGSVIGILIIGISKIRNGVNTEFNHQIPFGPFLACGYLSILFFHPQISQFLQGYF